MDRSEAMHIHEEVKLAVQQIARARGLEVQIGSGTFSATEFKLGKVTFTTTDAARVNWQRACAVVGLSAGDFGQSFYFQAKTYRIDGINLKAQKYPVIVFCVTDQKVYKFSASIVRDAMTQTRALQSSKP